MISMEEVEKLIALAKREGLATLSVGEFSATFAQPERNITVAIGFQRPDEPEEDEDA